MSHFVAEMHPNSIPGICLSVRVKLHLRDGRTASPPLTQSERLPLLNRSLVTTDEMTVTS